MEAMNTVWVVTRTAGGAGKRKEKEWSGEWSGTDHDMEVRRAFSEGFESTVVLPVLWFF
jgi:hypothetical protein